MEANNGVFGDDLPKKFILPSPSGAHQRPSGRSFVNRRTFLSSSAVLCSGSLLNNALPALAEVSADEWRTFEVVTNVELKNPNGPSHIWLPAALDVNTPYQRTLFNRFIAEHATVKLIRDGQNALGIVSATFPPNATPRLTLTSRVALKNYSVDLSSRQIERHASPSEQNYFLQPSRYVPTDGIVRDTALKATAGATTDLEKARALYDWVVKNTFRNPKVRGCGRGDIRFMLESGDMGGKCADLNALYVGLARSVGLAARHVYGLRIAESRLGYKSLGLSTNKATKGQHCRVEVYLREHGWVPVDPADVRKVVLEEPPGNRPLSDGLVSRAHERLFGSWEMNWMAYNYAHDVALPGSAGKPLVYFMYPQAENADGRVDPFDPDNFAYEITVKEIV
jgi:transglutaminase-like putative cysteine protease